VSGVAVADLGFSGRRFSLYRDRGFAELFQYTKILAIVLLLAGIALRAGYRYLIWCSLFFYFLLDDALQLHERLGAAVAAGLEFPPAFQLRAQDLGELTVVAGVGVPFAVLLALVWWRADESFRRDSRELALLVGGLAVVGVVLDMLNMMLRVPLLAGLIGVLEDGGEMVMMSLICWYTYRLFLRRNTYAARMRPDPALLA
jgi:hypothetical protein